MSTFAHVPLGPADPILGISEAYKNSTDGAKINLGVGAYRGPKGETWVLPSVRKAEEICWKKEMDKEYGPITGSADFVSSAIKLAYGKDSNAIKNKLIAASQSISGTGALRIGGEFLNRFYNKSKKIYLPTPTWGNHIPIFTDSGLEVVHYRYFDKKTNGLDLAGMLEDLSHAPTGSIVVLHACAHNPTGVDPTQDQWKEISQLIKSRQHFCFFDMAYQGFASGDTDKDAYALRYFVEQGHSIALAQSFAKNMGLYGERVGCFSILCASEEEQKAVLSQMKIVIRPIYSNPPINGARIASTIMQTPELNAQWLSEVKEMSGRIIKMRDLLKQKLKDLGSQKDWSHITNQIGMFCYTGLTPPQVERITKEFHVFLTKDGRISIAGINESNIDHLAKAIHEVTK